MATPFEADLRASMDLGCAVTIHTLTGEKLLTGVRDLNLDDGYLVVAAPQAFGDDSTTRTLLVHDVMSVTLHPDMEY